MKLGDREVKEFGVTCEIDFLHRFEFEQPLSSALVVDDAAEVWPEVAP